MREGILVCSWKRWKSQVKARKKMDVPRSFNRKSILILKMVKCAPFAMRSWIGWVRLSLVDTQNFVSNARAIFMREDTKRGTERRGVQFAGGKSHLFCLSYDVVTVSTSMKSVEVISANKSWKLLFVLFQLFYLLSAPCTYQSLLLSGALINLIT